MARAFVVKDDFDAFAANLTDLGRQEVPFAAARALSRTAEDGADAVQRRIETAFDRPNSFTKRAVGVIRASKGRPVATIYVKRIQARYLGIQETGGVRKPRRSALPDPVDIGLNAYGNLPRQRIKKLLTSPHVFMGKVGEVYGVWRRVGRGRKSLKLLIALDRQQEYKPRFKFYDTVERTVATVLRRNFGRELARAIATSRSRNINRMLRRG